jgi:predicted small integral membrane protein
MPTFLPFAYRSVVSGILDLVFTWSVVSALLSITMVVVAFITNPVCVIDGTCNILTLTPDTLVNSPPYAPLLYYEYLWVLLLIVALIGGFIFMITVAQSEDREIPADYYNNVAKKMVIYTGAVLFIWLVGPVLYLMIYNGTFIPPDILQEGLQGLRAVGASSPVTATDYIFKYIQPYWPGAVYVLAMFYILRNAHSGWIGDKWVEWGGEG